MAVGPNLRGGKELTRGGNPTVRCFSDGHHRSKLRVQMATRSQRLQGLELLENGVQNQELVPNDHYVEEQNITNADWRTNCYEYYPDGRIKRRRGPTKLANVGNLPEGVKIIVKLDRKFAIDGRANNWILHQLDGKWRQYKSKLKKGYYKPNLPMERVLQTVPKTVAESQWATLVSYWYSEDSKKISDKNKENAQNIKHPHILGRKSFARKRKELEVNGVEVDRATFFDECHKTKNGRYVNDATEEKMNEVYMKLAEKRVDGQELSEADFEQAMLEVFGKDHRGITTLAEKYPEDNLISRLPPSVARVIPRQEVDQNEGSQPPNTATSSLPFDQNHENQLPNTTPSSSARASSQSCSEEE
ncbi:hypothetical protein OsJ_00046 [Oryza sativa Japonica Group]|uniref:Transposase, Ptta/En/Spm, plant n=1 Tax=Oryza sativa subsp. japonica TaxID=39947 RepID=B9EYS8_ORYSJ|nr:hypothetical protein OsJ_00046 [Oryza sativa Japonica Group]